MPRSPRKKQYRRTFIREWREFRGLSQERLAERVGMTPGLISQLETRKAPYNQPLLEAIADALLCDPVDLLIRNPLDPEGVWSVWDSVDPTQRKQAIEILKTFKRKAS